MTRAGSDRPARLNIVLLSIRKAARFGGADTALRLFLQMASHYTRIRIIVVSEDETSFNASEWPEWTLDADNGSSAKSIVYSRGRRLPVAIEDSDVFIATHWMTAVAVRKALEHQSADRTRRFIYLIQDFEPSFYPWSGRFLMAQGTYANQNDVVALFNTHELQAYFARLGFAFPHSFAFEPRLNPSLAASRSKLPGHKKRKLMIVYGRPSTARNAFDILVGSLDEWARQYAGAASWELVSLGEKHKDVVLPGNLTLRSLGKVKLDEYAQYLCDAAVGFSLMVSPHPSYPPLEMASFGATVVTNAFADKDLPQRSPLIRAVADTSPNGFAHALIEACQAFEAGDGRVATLPTLAFTGGEEEFPFVDKVQTLVSPAR